MCPEWAAAMESMARPRASLAAVARAAFVSTSVAASAILSGAAYKEFQRLHSVSTQEMDEDNILIALYSTASPTRGTKRCNHYIQTNRGTIVFSLEST